jgi:tRNA G37 N-methylase TrmD
MTWRASVLTLFPAMFPGPLGQSLAGRALETGVWSLDVTNIRDFAADKHRTVDDQRVIDARGMEELSIGDYVLSGGDLAALVLLDSIVRLLPGVMGSADSAGEESFSAGLLEYPHYTKPAEWQGRRVPDVLLSGHHGAVAAWRQAESEKITRERRPDLWAALASQEHAA